MKLAIIGAVLGQEMLCHKARKMQIETIGFAWEKGATCKHLFDKFYPISIYDTDKIIDICKKERPASELASSLFTICRVRAIRSSLRALLSGLQ